MSKKSVHFSNSTIFKEEKNRTLLDKKLIANQHKTAIKLFLFKLPLKIFMELYENLFDKN